MSTNKCSFKIDRKVSANKDRQTKVAADADPTNNTGTNTAAAANAITGTDKHCARARAPLPYTLTHAHTIAPMHCRTHIEAHTEATLIHTEHSNARTHQHTH